MEAQACVVIMLDIKKQLGRRMCERMPSFVPLRNFHSNYNGSWIFFFTIVERRMSEKSQAVIRSFLTGLPWHSGGRGLWVRRGQRVISQDLFWSTWCGCIHCICFSLSSYEIHILGNVKFFWCIWNACSL